jgi:hypothetical protein
VVVEADRDLVVDGVSFLRRKDGAGLAGRLRGDLIARGLEVWLDTREIGGGKVRPREIEEGIDRAQVVLALMTGGAYRSEICRAEQLRSLRLRKCVIPLMAGERRRCSFASRGQALSRLHASLRQ